MNSEVITDLAFELQSLPISNLPVIGVPERHEKHYESIKLDELPTELLHHIFKSLTGVSLAHVSGTCRRFKAVVNHSEEAQVNFWRDICLRDLEKEQWLDVGCNYWKGLWRSSQFNDPLVPWKKIYQRVMMWKFMTDWPSGSVHTIGFLLNEDRDEFTSLEVVGSYIITGDKSGNVLMWDTDGLLCGINFHCGKIKSIAVIVTENESNHQLQYQVLSLSNDRVLQSVTLHGGMKVSVSSDAKRVPFNFITSSKDTVTGWCDYGTNNIRSVLPLKDGFQTLSICSSDSIRCSGRILTVGVFNDKVKIVTQNEGPFIYNEGDSRWVRCLPEVVDVSIREAYIWQGDITFCITYLYQVWVSVGEHSVLQNWTQYRPTCAVLYGKLLAVGSYLGKVFFYLIDERNDLMHINPLKYKKAFCVSDEPIISIKVLEDNEGYVRPQVIAATRNTLYCISFE